MNNLPRRDFLKTAATASAGLRAPRILGANGRIRIGVCGLRYRGLFHMRAWSQIPGVELAALCDVDENVLRWRLRTAEAMGLPRPQAYTDPRRMLDAAQLDAVSIATPNHWHSLLAIWCCQAGKDVYVEKPCCHTLWEGRQLVAAVKKYGRICQHGTQSRSHRAVRQAIATLRAGTLGELYMGRALIYKWRPSIGHAPVQPVPAGVNYDLWTGPARLLPFTLNRFHYNWHWQWNTGNGELGNQGPHQLDIARWGLDVVYPRRVSAFGGKFLFHDDQQTPNVLSCLYEFATHDGKRKLLEAEVRGWVTNHEAGIGAPRHPGIAARPPANVPDLSRFIGDDDRLPLGPVPHSPSTVGNLFYGEKGYLRLDGNRRFQCLLGPEQQPGPSGSGGGNHFLNFIDAVRAHNPRLLHAPIEEGLASVALVHLANASYRTGQTLELEPDSWNVIGNPLAAELLRGEYRSPYQVPKI